MIPDSSQNIPERQDQQDRAEKLSRAISYLDDDLIQEAMDTRRVHRLSSGRIRKWVMPMAACLLFASILVATFAVSQRSKNESAFPEYGENNDLKDGSTLEIQNYETVDEGWATQSQQTGSSQWGTTAMRPEDQEPQATRAPTYSGTTDGEPGVPDESPSEGLPEGIKPETKDEYEGSQEGEPSTPGEPLHVGDSTIFYGGSLSFLSEDAAANTITLLLNVDRFSPGTYIVFNTTSGAAVATNNPAGAGYGLLAVKVNGQISLDGSLPSIPGQYTVTVDYSRAVANSGVRPASFTLTGSQQIYLSLTGP